MPIQTGLIAGDIRSGRKALSFAGAPVNAIPISYGKNFEYSQIPNEYVYSAKTVGLAAGASVVVHPGSATGFMLNMFSLMLSGTTEIQLLNGATVMLFFFAQVATLYTLSFMPQGLPGPNDGQQWTVKNQGAAACDFYINFYGCAF